MDEGIRFSIESGSGYPGQGGCFYSCGKLYLTNVRLIIVPDVPSAFLTGFTLPFTLMKECSLETPWIGDAVVKGVIEPIEGGGLKGMGNFTIIFPSNRLAKSFWTLCEPLRSKAGAEYILGTEVERKPHDMVRSFLVPVDRIVMEQSSSADKSHAYVDASNSSTILLPK